MQPRSIIEFFVRRTEHEGPLRNQPPTFSVPHLHAR